MTQAGIEPTTVVLPAPFTNPSEPRPIGTTDADNYSTMLQEAEHSGSLCLFPPTTLPESAVSVATELGGEAEGVGRGGGSIL